MRFQYNLTASDLLKQLGYTNVVKNNSIKKEETTCLEQDKNLKLPPVLSEFLNLAKDCPLLSTADVYTNFEQLRFLYDDIQEWIDYDTEYWEKNPEKYKENEYFQLSKLPKEQWEIYVPNYLIIGSDYAAVVVQFGIRLSDIQQDNPPVYMNHECDSIFDWQLFDETVSDFLIRTLCDVLCCTYYNTASHILKEAGWTFRKLSKEDLSKQIDDMSAMLRCKSKYTVYGCAYSKEENRLLTVRFDKDNSNFDSMEYQKEKN